MAIIALEGIRIYARHGYYEEEAVLGTEFVLDIYVEAEIQPAAGEDALARTVNYETIYLLCQSEMKKTSRLIETVAQRIADRITGHFDGVLGVRVRLRKMNPPLGGSVGCAYVEVEQGSFGWPKLKTLRKIKQLVEGWQDIKKKFEQL
jgi:7,8-dihydroneopterin aldolase/epimerase/oxygenase